MATTTDKKKTATATTTQSATPAATGKTATATTTQTPASTSGTKTSILDKTTNASAANTATTAKGTTYDTNYVSSTSGIVSANGMSGWNQNQIANILSENGLTGSSNNYDNIETLKSYIGNANGNNYVTTIGNATLNQYGYYVDDNGLIQKQEKNEAPQKEALNTTPDATNWIYGETKDYINSATQNTIDAINKNKETVESDYQDQQKQAYIQKVLGETQAKDYLKAQGYSGGMTETTIANLQNVYEQQRQAAYNTKQNALNEIEKLVAEARATGDTSLANAALQYMQQYQEALQFIDQMNYNYYTADLAQYNTNRDYEASQAQQAYSNAWNEKTYADSKAQQEYENAWNEKTWQASQDQQAYENAFNEKVYADQQKQQEFDNNLALKKLGLKSSSSSSSSSKKKTTDTTDDTATDTPITSDSQLSAKALKVKNYLTASLIPGQNISSEKKSESLAWIEDYYNSGTINEKEAKYIASLIGISL